MVLDTNFAQEANEMLTKTRTAIIFALAASASIGVAPVAPAVIQGEPATNHASNGKHDQPRSSSDDEV